MQSRALPEDGRARSRWHIRRRRGEGVPGRPHAGLAISASTAIAVLGLSCGDGAVEPAPPPAPVATTVAVSPSESTIALGDTLRLAAEAYDENGHRVDGAMFSWSSSDAGVVRVDGAGLVTGVAEGAATITAMAGDAQGSSGIKVENPDRAALVALYHATDGTNWVNNENWLTDAPLEEWYGVGTDGYGRVVRLVLRGTTSGSQTRPHGLNGPIPPELGSLTKLVSLSLDLNELSGSIPLELGNLANLERLELPDNRITGLIPPQLGNLTQLTDLELDDNDLTGPIPPELGNLTRLTNLELDDNNLTGPIPAELGNLAELTNLELNGNGLTGTVPPELGGLAELEALSLRYNNLTGPIPESLLALDALEWFGFDRNTDLCAPGTIDFVTWLEGIEETTGPYCNESDTDVLNQLYETAGGADWTNAIGWRETPALAAWYGVTANSLGRVTALDLSRNRLVGRLPANLGELTQMTELRIADNPDLSGLLPLSLDRLALRTLHYAGTGLCAPFHTSFRDWLGTIPFHEGTDAECGQPAEAVFDPLVSRFMEQHDITAGAIGFSKDGVVVYERAFGWMDQERSIPVPDDVMMRLMSVSKPFTAAAIHELVGSGQLDLDSFAFDLGQPEGGVLKLDPFPALEDQRLADITIRHLLLHRGGWSRGEARESWAQALKIAEAMAVPSPPGPRNTLRYILGEPLVFDPGSRSSYSNNGYLVLQTIIEEVSGRDYMDYLLHVLAPLGVSGDNIIRAGTLPKDRNPREPWYDATNSPSLGRNVFDPSGPLVYWPDGRWDIGGAVGVGGLVATPRAVLTFLDAYVVSGDKIGMRRSRADEPTGYRRDHTGGSTGSSALARQRGDGIDFVVLFNRRDGDVDYHRMIRDEIDGVLDSTAIRWPQQ